MTAAAVIFDFDAALVHSAFHYAGMPREYRSGLMAARHSAEQFLKRTRSRRRHLNPDTTERIELAQQLIEGTHAIIFSMRHSLPQANTFAAVRNSLHDMIRILAPDLLDDDALASAINTHLKSEIADLPPASPTQEARTQ